MPKQLQYTHLRSMYEEKIMKHKYHYIRRCGGALLVGIACCGLSAFSAQSAAQNQMQQVQDIQTSFIGAIETQMELGCFTSDSGRATDLNENDRLELQKEYEEKVNRYYSTDNVCRERYIDLNKTYLDDSQTDVIYTVTSGILDYRFHSVQISADELTATVDATYVVYDKRICSNESQQFEIAVPINQDTVSATMIRENNIWKLQSIDSLDTIFADDAVSVIKENNVLPSVDVTTFTQDIDAFDAICEKNYPTFQSALNAINGIDEHEINPFNMLNEVKSAQVEDAQ